MYVRVRVRPPVFRHTRTRTRTRTNTNTNTRTHEQVEILRDRLSNALKLPDGSALLLAASGTCAEYVPLAIARELYPTAPIRSVLAAGGETGGGGVNAW